MVNQKASALKADVAEIRRALGLSLGGPAIYHGELHERPTLGEGDAPTARDIERALDMVWAGVGLWLLALLLGGWLDA